MRYLLGFSFLLSVLVLGCGETTCPEGAGGSGGDPLTEAEAAAIEMLEVHMQARNERDSEGLAAANNYPHVRLGGGHVFIWETPEEKAQAVATLRQRGYRTQPLRRVYIAKSGGRGKRPLSIPCLSDRAMQALYLLALDPIAETLADLNSYGFRLERSTADAIDQCHRVLSLKRSAEWILEGDIRSCFDSGRPFGRLTTGL